MSTYWKREKKCCRQNKGERAGYVCDKPGCGKLLCDECIRWCDSCEEIWHDDGTEEEPIGMCKKHMNRCKCGKYVCDTCECDYCGWKKIKSEK